MTTMINADKFIEEIKARPTIWNVHSAGYANKKKKTNAWEEICRVFQPEFDRMKVTERSHLCRSMQRRWRSYRDCFVRELNIQKKETRLGTINPNRRKYVFYDKLTFLIPNGQRTSIFTTYKHERDNQTETDTEDEEWNSNQEDHKEQSAGEQGLETKMTVISKPQSESCDKSMSEKDLSQTKLFDDSTKCFCDERNEDKLFLLSLLTDMTKIPEENKLYAKTEIMLTLRKWQKVQARRFKINGPQPTMPSPTMSDLSNESSTSNSSGLLDLY